MSFQAVIMEDGLFENNPFYSAKRREPRGKFRRSLPAKSNSQYILRTSDSSDSDESDEIISAAIKKKRLKSPGKGKGRACLTTINAHAVNDSSNTRNSASFPVDFTKENTMARASGQRKVRVAYIVLLHLS